jgi:hypothetical protein
MESKSLDVWNQMGNTISIKYLSSASEVEMAVLNMSIATLNVFLVFNRSKWQQ